MEAEAPPKPIAAAYVPFSATLTSMFRIWSMKCLTYLYFNYLTWKNPPGTKGGATYIKSYAAVPDLKHRVFIPNSYKAGDKPLPLLIDIHGGGFAVGAPIMDDDANNIKSQEYGLCVVSLQYHLAPTTRFPTATKELAQIIQAVIADPEIPVDRSKVAMCGYSAGGNLVLSAAQLLSKGLVKGIVSYYPVTDFSIPGDEKLKYRTSDGKEDMLKKMSPAFNWAYVQRGTDLTEHLLSPIFAPREKLPEKLYILGCEYDMLCHEAEVTAERWAKSEYGEKRMIRSDGTCWQKGNVRWEKVLGHVHGFNQVPSNNPEEKKLRRDRTLQMYDDTVKWLKEEVYA